MKPEDWNNFEDVPATHFDGPTQKELEEAEKRADLVHSPKHYTKGGIECIEAIKASMSKEAYKGYLKGNCFKYLWRYEDKGKMQDLQKAEVYLDWLIDEEGKA
jgi:hypothetical protein